ncbi:Uncharacterised protein [Segatella copri]|nr:Uncharacterised protein [Segatella copri]
MPMIRSGHYRNISKRWSMNIANFFLSTEKRKKFLPLFWRRKVVIWLTWGMAARLSPFRW